MSINKHNVGCFDVSMGAEITEKFLFIHLTYQVC